jgi:hypothetical protein
MHSPVRGAKLTYTAARGDTMAKPNFAFQKRQKELEKKKKNDEKLQRKLEKKGSQVDEESDQAPDGDESVEA